VRRKRAPLAVDPAQLARIRRARLRLGSEARPNAADLDSQDRVRPRFAGPRRLQLTHGDAGFLK
jgi:hypothetical protein